MARKLLDAGIAQKAVFISEDYIDSLMRQFSADGLYVVIRYPVDVTIYSGAWPMDESGWNPDFNYRELANSKADLAAEYRRSSREVVHISPHHLGNGSVLYAGAIYWDGIVVGVSGLPSAFDEALGYSLAALLIAFCYEEIKPLLLDPNNTHLKLPAP